MRAETRNCQSSQAPARPTSWPALRTLAIFSIDLPFLRGRDRCCRGPAGTSLPLAGRTSLPWAHPTRPPVAEGRTGLARGDPAGCGQAAWRPRPPALGGAQRGWAPRSAGRDKSSENSPAATADRRPTAKKVRKLQAYGHTDIQANRQTDIQAYVRTCVQAYGHTYRHTYRHTYVCTYVCTYVRMYGCMYVHTYVCMYVRSQPDRKSTRLNSSH